MISIAPIAKSIAKQMIVKNHYTHKWTSCNVALGLFVVGTPSQFFNDTTDDKLVGTAVFGYPTGCPVVKSISDTLQTRNVYELTRLWLQDDMPKNSESQFIRMCIKWIEKHKPDIKVIISYADPEQNHRGVIYQAANFYYQKVTDNILSPPAFSFDDGKNWLHPKTVYDIYGTIRRDKLPVNTITKPIYQKHRYILPLGNKLHKKQLMKSLKHPIAPYPKV